MERLLLTVASQAVGAYRIRKDDVCMLTRLH